MNGYVVLHNGHPVWVGHPDRDTPPRITVHEDVSAARRQLTRIARANRNYGVDWSGMSVGRIRIEVEAVGEPVTIRWRDR